MSLSNLQSEIDQRVKRFEMGHVGPAVSIKIRPPSGCFHREHSPNAYQMIDEWLSKHDHSMFSFEEHESGPEIIAAVNSITAIINFIVAILKARFDGIKKGDKPHHSIELIVRKIERSNEYIEEVILKTDHLSPNLADEVDRALRQSKLLSSKSQSKCISVKKK